MNIRTYLERIRYSGPLEPAAPVLSALHEAHMLSVPFENLDIHCGRPIVLDEARLFTKLVGQRRGGFCYELNGLFAWLLREMGFEVIMLSARVATEGGGFGPEYDHMALRVDLDEPWLADVGFGDSFLRPLRLSTSDEQIDPAGRFRLVPGEPDWRMEKRNTDGSWVGEYLFTMTPRSLGDYAAMCTYHQTSPESHFTRKRVCSLATPAGRVTLRDDRLIVTEGGRREESPVAGEASWRAALQERFGAERIEAEELARRVARSPNEENQRACHAP